MAGLFQVLWGEKGGVFKPAETLCGTDGEPLIIPVEGKEQITKNICTRPIAVDWNGDGHLDLVVGNFEGTFHLFTGEGRGKFQPKSEPIKAGNQPLNLKGHHSDPFVVDWDGDGDLDLLSGSTDGGVQWAENVGSKGSTPQLKPFTWLIPPVGQVTYGGSLAEKDLKGPTTATRIWVDDVNGDGKLDILVGDNILVSSRKDGLTQEEYETQKTRWDEEQVRLLAQLNGLPADASAAERNKANLAFQQHQQKRAKFVNEARTGFVWLYVQK